MRYWNRRCRRLVLAVSLTGLGACAKPPPTAVPMTPPTVSVSQPLQKEVVERLEYTGTTAALESVEIRARVKGFLQGVEFQPRAKVAKDALLFVIDPSEYQAKLEAAQAMLLARKAELEFATYEFDRTDDLFNKGSAAPYERTRDLAKKHAAEAAVQAAQASMHQAELDLGYTKITAPLNGRVSRNLVDVGNLVGSGENTLLTTIVNDDSVYVYFDLSENDLLALMRARAARADTKVTPDKIDAPLFLGLAGEPGFPHEGRIDFIETTVNPATGTIRVRGVFANTDGTLLPGLFARVRIPIGQPRSALLVTERALGVDQGQRFVLVVNDQNVVDYRRVDVGMLDQGLRVIEKGLSAGDLVIVNGLQRVRPGVPVTPHRVAMDSLSAVATQPAGAAGPTPSPATRPAH
jgi:membrane fusion protein, multidrug efflux system